MKLRIIWIIPNMFIYLLFVGSAAFVLIHAEGLKSIHELGIWLFRTFLLLLAALFGTYRILSWIKQGKM